MNIWCNASPWECQMVKRRSRAETSRKSIETHSGQHLRPMWRGGKMREDSLFFWGEATVACPKGKGSDKGWCGDAILVSFVFKHWMKEGRGHGGILWWPISLFWSSMYKKQQNVYYSVEVRERFDYCFEIIRKENNKDRKGMFFLYLLFFTFVR